jgi:peptidoglycan/xylan/chitin deacetylase (PgdA/CDA1 family)
MYDLTIVMYHYVRPIKASIFPRIKGLELEGFKRQLDFLEERYTIVSSDQIITAISGGKNLPPNACWLTFDDGYKDHFKYVLPELLKRNLSGAFFPPRIAIETNTMLNVNSIHHILACNNNIKDLINELHGACLAHGFEESFLSSLYEENALPNRWDNADIIYFKRMLQYLLPEDERTSITASLFKKYIGITESEFSSELYMNLREVRQMINSGMYVGSHGSQHHWLDKISIKDQRRDIQDSLSFLESVGAPTKQWIMCYPWGAYNNDTLSTLRETGALIGLTTEVRKANILRDEPLTLPRFNTNDFPQ